VLADWNLGSAPNSPLDIVEIQSGTSNYDISGAPTFIGLLIVDPSATLNIKAGQLIAGALIDNGTININSDPVLEIDGPATIGKNHILTVSGSGNQIIFNGLVTPGTTVDNQGTILALDHGAIHFKFLDDVTNELGGKIVADGKGPLCSLPYGYCQQSWRADRRSRLRLVA
jgi:hypothetical protein